MCKKICVLVLAICGGVPAYATTDIQPNGNLAGGNTAANCTQPVLGTYSGSTNFEAKWRANEVPIRWYDNNTQMQNVGTDSNTCNYDGTLTIPATPPSRVGYNFAGWRVRPQFDFSTLAHGGTNALSTGLERWAITLNSTKDRCWHKLGTGGLSDGEECLDSSFSDIERYEWKVQYSSGTVYGAGYCSAESGDSNGVNWNNASSNWKKMYSTLESTSGTKQYCWCQATGWKPTSNNPNGIVYGQTSMDISSSWVFVYDYGSAPQCTYYCTNYCAARALDSTSFRRAIFTLN